MVVTSTFQLVVKAEDDNTLVEPSPATFAARLDGWTNLTLNGTLNSSSLSKENNKNKHIYPRLYHYIFFHNQNLISKSFF